MTKMKEPIFYKPEIGSIWKVKEGFFHLNDTFLFMVVGHGSSSSLCVKIEVLTPADSWSKSHIRYWVFCDRNEWQYEQVS